VDGSGCPAAPGDRVLQAVPWLLRAAWMAEELLMTFEAELGEVALVPGTGGIFDVRLDRETIWLRRAQAGFPELAALRRMVRDRVATGTRARALGGSLGVGAETATSGRVACGSASLRRRAAGQVADWSGDVRLSFG